MVQEDDVLPRVTSIKIILAKKVENKLSNWINDSARKNNDDHTPVWNWKAIAFIENVSKVIWKQMRVITLFCYL